MKERCRALRFFGEIRRVGLAASNSWCCRQLVTLTMGCPCKSLGFQRLAEDVAHGRIGAIFALEASRLARRSADWHRLLDLCCLADVVIADDQSVYAPCNYDDQLLLGLKGTMAEAESVWMRRRMQGGKLAKARRGALYQNPPIGYVWDGQLGKFVFDPDGVTSGYGNLSSDQMFRPSCGTQTFRKMLLGVAPPVDGMACFCWVMPDRLAVKRSIYGVLLLR